MSTRAPKVTIAIPSYNHSQFISQAIESVFAQTYENWELIIVDDGSSDDSREVLRNDPRLADARVKLLLHEHNSGQARRLNEAIAAASGEFISFLPSDDWYDAKKIELQVRAFSKLADDYGVVYSNGYRYIQDTGETFEYRPSNPVQGDILLALLEDWGLLFPAAPLVRMKCVREYPFWDQFKSDGEAIYWRIAMKYKFAYLDEYVCTMRAHTYNSGSNIQTLHVDIPKTLVEIFSHPDFPPQHRHLRDQLLSRYYRFYAWNALRQHSNPALWAQCIGAAVNWDLASVVKDPRTYLSLPLALIPKRRLRQLNDRMNRLRIGERYRVRRTRPRPTDAIAGDRDAR